MRDSTIYSLFRRRARRPRASVLPAWGTAAALVMATPLAYAGNAIELGIGWENLGALEGTLEWQPSVQGSRKDVPVFLGWRYIGERRVFWAPSARASVTNFWSIGGGGNFISATIAPVGVGVYLTRPPEAWSPESRRGRWFVTASLGASVRLGSNLTPDQPQNAKVPDPEAHRTALRTTLQQGGVIDVLNEEQHYPLGDYAFAALGLPLRIDAWGMATQRVGVGFFVEAHPLILEWQIGSGGSATPAYGYSMTAGLTTVLF